jgi:hypothetical protein
MVLLAACGTQGTTTDTSSPPAPSSATTPSAMPTTGGSSSAPAAAGATTDPPATTSTPAPVKQKLLSATFTKGAGVFHTGSTRDFRYAVRDGVYVMTSTTSKGGMAKSYGEFSRTAYTVDLSADVVDVQKATLDGLVGIACMDARALNGVMVLTSVDGATGVVMPVVKGDPQDPILSWTEQVASVPLLSLRLSTDVTSSSRTRATVRVWVNGSPVPGTGTMTGFKGCSGAVLTLLVEKKGASVGFDNVLATVPGE